MAMMALFGPTRLTRDVDLDFPELRKRTADSLHNQVMRALRAALRGSGVQDARISEAGKAVVSPKWKVSGRTAHGEPFHMKVEVSRRPPPPGEIRQAAVSGVSAFGLGTYYVDLYDEETLVAVVSLNSALDEAGIYNNPPTGVTAVVPLDTGPVRPRVGIIETAQGNVFIRAMPRRMLEAGSIEDRLDLERSLMHPQASAEKALLDWLYLAQVLEAR
jgi:hypothetical protein